MERAIASGFDFRSIAGLHRGCHEVAQPTLPTGIATLDEVLPGGGLPLGRLTELTGRRAAGKLSLAMLILARVLARGEAAALLDPEQTAAPDLWLEPAMERLLVVRGGGTLAALRAADALLETGMFALLVLDLPGRAMVQMGSEGRRRSLSTAAFARLARAARQASSTLVLVSEWLPWRPEGLASLVDLRLDVHPLATRESVGPSIQVTVTKSKRGGVGMNIRLDASAMGAGR